MKLYDSYFIEHVDNGCITLTVNLLNKSTKINRVSATEFWLWEEENEVPTLTDSLLVDGLPDDNFSVFNQRCKYQITFLYIPTYQIVKPVKQRNHLKEKYESNK